MATKPTQSKQTKKQAPQRKYKDQLEFEHDLFELQVADVFKNMSWNKKKEWERFPHKHFFHTFDSDGRKLIRSTAALGHYHKMEVTDQGEGEPPVVVCGPAFIDRMMADDDGVYRKTAIELTGKEAHTHELEYRYSDKLKARKPNSESLKVINKVIQNQNPALDQEEAKNLKNSEYGSRPDKGDGHGVV